LIGISVAAEALPPAAPKDPDIADRLIDAGQSIGSSAQWAWDVELVHVANVAVTPGKLMLALLMIVATWLLSALLRRGLDRVEKRGANAERRAAFYTVGRILHYVLLIVGVMLALEVLGIEASRFAIFAGAIGVGLGFGLQAIFSNFISGLILLFDRSLKVGDFVELESGRGL
jgi:small-conductance mechanosensitive channel